MVNKFPKSLQGIDLLPGLQVRVVMLNGASANNGTGGIPYVLTGSLVAEVEDRHHDDQIICPPVKVNVDVKTEAELEPEFLVLDLGTTGTTILVPGSIPSVVTLTGIVAVNLNLVQIIAPVTPL
jgi:hypothetical protein